MNPGSRRVALFLAGFFVLQVAWVFAVPPFRAIDEFDHSYRATSVAQGEWVAPPAAATRGTGAWVRVPADMVEAAAPECRRLPYTGASECTGTPEGNAVRVASGAGRYNPVFYAVVGTAALPFDGTSALYAMRVAAACVCLGLLFLALVAMRSWARSHWPYLGLAVALTPMVAYTTMVPAPNGVEMMAALALWCALVGLAQRRDPPDRSRLLVITGVAACVLVTVRSLGPLWCVLILATVWLAFRPDAAHVRALVRSRGWIVLSATVVATALSVGWIRVMGSLEIQQTPQHLSAADRLSESVSSILLWTLQSIGAFPLRNQSTHPLVYLSVLLLGGWLLVQAVRRGTRSLQIALLVAIAISVLVPVVITFETLNSNGSAWQGRYTLPYSMGVMVLAGVALDRAAVGVRREALYALGALYAAAQAAAPFLVALHERRYSPGVADGAWVLVPPAVLAVVAFLGAATVWAAASSRQDEQQEVPDDRPQRERGVVGVGG